MDYKNQLKPEESSVADRKNAQAQDPVRIGGLTYSERLKTPLISIGNVETKRKEIKEYFNQTYSATQDLFTTLSCHQAYYTRADPPRAPGRCLEIYGSWDDLDEKHYNWPTVPQVTEYRNKVREVVNQVIDNLQLKIPIKMDDPAWIILMGIELERSYLETSSVLIRQLPLELVRPQPNWPIYAESGMAPTNQLLVVAGGLVTLGRETTSYYGWDNEFGSNEEIISPFAAAEYPVTNMEFLEFVEIGGYESMSWWTDDGWKWLEYYKAKVPRFWRKEGEQWKLRCMTHLIAMPWDWPVEVNYFEAKAFCNWLSEKTKEPIRLPTEAEWLHLRETEFPAIRYPGWGNSAPGNIDLAYWASSCPVTKFKHGRFYDLIGNAWEWTETQINAFPGFKVHPAYEDFSTPSFDGQHNLIKSGSWITTGNAAIDSSRYAFRRHFYQQAGFRYIRSEQAPSTAARGTALYESDTFLAQYLEFHFGQPYFNTENYPAAIVKYAMEALGRDHPKLRAMDVGSAVGRSSFELAKYFDHVVGLDFSTRFIRSAIDFQNNGLVRWQVREEGELTSAKQITMEELELNHEIMTKVKFLQGNACNLRDNLRDFDVVIAANLIDRLYNPMKFLNSIQDRITPGGILVISSPYTWLEDYTEKSKWLGGYKDVERGENISTFCSLKQALSPCFDLCEAPRDVEFVIRETAREFQHAFAQLTIWKKK